MAGGVRAMLRVTGPDRVRRIVARLLVALGLFLSALTVLAFAAAVVDDYGIEHHTGHADADVLSAGYQRTVVRFVTPDGAVHVPATGVLYPRRVETGMRIRVEYDTQNPDLVRVAGRNWHLGLLPMSTTLLGIWIVVLPACYLLRRRRASALPGPPAEHLVGDAGRGDQETRGTG